MPSAPKSSAKVPINNNYFTGGVSIDPALGIANSFYYSQSLDFRSKPSQLTVLPGSRQLNNTLGDNILAMDQDLNGVRWGVGSGGGLFQIDTSNNVTKIETLSESGSAGLLYYQTNDQLYIPGQTKVSMYGQVTTGNPGQPTWRPDNFAQSASTAASCTNLYYPATGLYSGVFRNTAASTYSVPLAIVEDATDLCGFAPDIEPGYSIQVYIVAKGTGDWTLTLHDALNTTLASVTVANAALTNGAYNEFAFGKQVRVSVPAFVSSGPTGAATYHFHLTSTVNDGTAQVVTSGDLSTCNFLWLAYRMVAPHNSWHPTTQFYVQTSVGSGNCLCIGNGNYLSTYNFSADTSPTNTQWIRHQLLFPAGYEVCGLSTNNQYLVIAVERRTTNSSRNFQDGALYFWDGVNSTPNFKIDIPMGAPYGLYTNNNITYFACAGSLFAWSGGQTVIKVRQLAYQNTDYLGAVDHTIVNPNMFTTRYNLLMMGYPSSTTNANINYGVWSWGAVELTFPNSYGLSYTLSNGHLNNTSPISGLQIGSVYNFVDTMYISWQYTDTSSVIHYGLDILDNFSTAASSGSWEALLYDGGERYKQKYAHRLKISFSALPTGATITPYYILERGAAVVSTISGTTGQTDILLEINKRFHEIQYGFNFTCPTGLTTPPRITGITLEVSPIEEEVGVTQDG